MNELRPLSRKECVTLLASMPVGRLVFTEGALPAIRPVNFFLHGDDIIIRTSPGSAIGKLTNEVVAFETDNIDLDTHTGWSVVAVGKIEPVTDIDHLVTLSDPHHQPWAPNARGRLLRIPIEILTGRRISPAECA